MQVLQIIASSWPITIMFITTCIALIALYIIRWLKKSDLDDKALRASNALTVRNTEHR